MPKLLAATAAATAATAALALAPTTAEAAVARPTRLHVTTGSAGTWLTWAASGAGHFQIEQATDARFRSDRRVYVDRDGRDRVFTPYGLARGRTYYWRVRALSGSHASHWSAAVHTVVRSAEQRVRVMQFNVSDEGGEYVNGHLMPGWTTRRDAVVSTIRGQHPDVVAVEEAAGWVGRTRGARVADDVAARLGSPYALARTEIPPSEPHYFRTGDYIVYNSATYRAVGSGGHWVVGSAVYAAYQLLQSRSTGASLLFVSTHLANTSGRSGDVARQQQMQRVIDHARSYAAAHGHVPVVYAGDVNSHDGHNHAFDGPGRATRAAHISDAFKSAYRRVNVKYDSANQYSRRPPAFGRSIDRLFAQAGVGIVSWHELLRLSGGRWVGVIPSDHNAVVADMTIPG
jgi:endonuclease/exonuclease/phosphatase family metal-dependent hydrolase